MNVEQVLGDVCKQVVEQGEQALALQRIDRDCAARAMPEVLSMEMAELHNLNDLVTRVVDRAHPLWKALGIRVVLQLDQLLPPVQMLVQPTEEAIAVALDICLAGDLDTLRVHTRVCRDRAVLTLERLLAPRFGVGQPYPNPPSEVQWIEAGSMGRLELVVGDRTTRALGGRMRLQHRDGDLRLWLELPILNRPHAGWLAGFHDPAGGKLGWNRMQFPPDQGEDEIPMTCNQDLS